MEPHPAANPQGDPAGAEAQPAAPFEVGQVLVMRPAGPVPTFRPPMVPRRRRVVLPLLLFLATCVTTFIAGGDAILGWEARPLNPDEIVFYLKFDWHLGLSYMVGVMTVLMAHEMGHFVQALRYGIPASLPFFLPMPFPPIGTMGAVIAMRGSQANRRQLFDIGITGPWTGLAVAIPLAIVGFTGWERFHIQPAVFVPPTAGWHFGDPLAFTWLSRWLRPEVDPSMEFVLNPLLRAAWVGLLVTGLNMLPIGQLDGGHVAYALFGRSAHWLARGMVAAAVTYMIVLDRYELVVMLVLVMVIGIHHPPTADDRVRLGLARRIFGLGSLVIPILCLTPRPIYFVEPPSRNQETQRSDESIDARAQPARPQTTLVPGRQSRWR